MEKSIALLTVMEYDNEITRTDGEGEDDDDQSQPAVLSQEDDDADGEGAGELGIILFIFIKPSAIIKPAALRHSITQCITKSKYMSHGFPHQSKPRTIVITSSAVDNLETHSIIYLYKAQTYTYHSFFSLSLSFH